MTTFREPLVWVTSFRALLVCVALVGAACAPAPDDVSAPDDVTPPAGVPPDAPRLLTPAPCSRTTGRSPSFAFISDASAQIELQRCADRTCATPALLARGFSPVTPPELPRGLLFVRAVAVRDGQRSAPSPVYQMRIGASRAAAPVSAWGAELDLDGDGRTDVLVGAPLAERVYLALGGATAAPAELVPPSPDEHYFGGSVTAAGDVDGDGFCDVAIGAPGHAGHGRVVLLMGGPGGRVVAVDAPGLEAERFGDRVAAAGDVNGDGFGDVAVGDFQAASGAGRAHVLLGDARKPGGRVISLSSPRAPSFGATIAGPGDVDGDGFGDVVVGAPDDPDRGTLHVFFGGALGLSAAHVLAHPTAGATLRGDLAAVGDVDGDGRPDFAAGDREGGLVVFSGSGPRGAGAARFATRAVSATAGDAPPPRGLTVAAAGDLDGDGFDDVAVGMPAADDFKGRMAVFFGGRDAWRVQAVATPPGPLGGFGFAIGTPGDRDADGHPDLLVGAPGTEPGGRLFVMSADAMGGLSPLRALDGPGGADPAFGGILSP